MIIVFAKTFFCGHSLYNLRCHMSAILKIIQGNWVNLFKAK